MAGAPGEICRYDSLNLSGRILRQCDCVNQIISLILGAMNCPHLTETSATITPTPQKTSASDIRRTDFVTSSPTTVLINPLSPHDALKHHFKSLKTDLIFLQPGVSE